MGQNLLTLPRTLIIMPVFNESQSLSHTLEATRAAAPFADILVVDDGSLDGSSEVASRLDAKVVSHSVNMGVGAAVQTGFIYALRHGYQVAVQIDADGQHDPAYVRPLVEALGENAVDIMIGSRYLNHAHEWKNSLYRTTGIRFFSWITSRCTAQKITDCTCGLRAVGIRALLLFSKEYPVDFPDAEALILAGRKGLKIAELPVIAKKRQNGNSKLTFYKSIYYPMKEFLSIFLLVSGRS